MASAQIAMPLTDQAVFLSYAVVLALLTATCAFACMAWPSGAVFRVLLAVFVLAMAVEAVGIRTGVPFGSYAYSDKLHPQPAGVPVLVGLAWAAMLLPAWDVARRIAPGRWVQAALTGMALVLWDLFLDPQMIGNGFWYFENPSGWNGVPLSNTFGWFITGATLSLLPMRMLDARVSSDGLAFLYAWMIGFSALGYLVPFALDDQEIGAVGVACAAPLLFLAFRRRSRPWLESQ
jgi:uncharacterized membrane protein